jgi:hypothetical protein
VAVCREGLTEDRFDRYRITEILNALDALA